MQTYLIGIDEVGRGPLAGPVTLCACAILEKDARRILRNEFKGLRDSKKISPQKREALWKIAKLQKKEGAIMYAVSHVSAGIIDKEGIGNAVRKGIKRCLKKIEADPKKSKILLDGSLYAPEEFKNQKTIIKGDDRIPVISLASVIAKVTRDKKMVRLSKIYPAYGFDIHKGYGTSLHIKSLKTQGPCDIHRRSFISNIVY